MLVSFIFLNVVVSIGVGVGVGIGVGVSVGIGVAVKSFIKALVATSTCTYFSSSIFL